MTTAIAFDVYGTLIDTQGIAAVLAEKIGEAAPDFARRWREKQLEYTFRRGLMGSWASFDVCTRQALDFVDEALGSGLGEDDKQRLMVRYMTLPAFDDVAPAMAALSGSGRRLYAFSNGRARSVEMLLSNAGIRDVFADVVSVEPLATFKPDRRVYAYFAERAGVPIEAAWLVSSNAFDVIGALTAGMHAVWLRRDSAQPFDPWGVEPTVEIASLGELARVLDDIVP